MSVGHRQGLMDAYGRPLEPGDEVVLREPIVGCFVVQAIERPKFDAHGNPMPAHAIRVHLRAALAVEVMAFQPTGLVRIREKAELIKAGVIREEKTAGEALEEATEKTPPADERRPGPSLVLTDVEKRP